MSRSPTWSCIGSTRAVLEDGGCRGAGNGSCPPAFRSGFFLGRLGTRTTLSQRPSHRFPGSLRDVHQRRINNGHPILADRLRTRTLAVLLTAARIEPTKGV